MKTLFVALVFPFLLSGNFWLTNMDQAKQEAQKEHKYIILNFSGSDWCGPCIRMHEEIFGSTVFKEYAEPNLVMVNADFPRKKKNQLSKDQQKLNDTMADQYNPKGIFPYTLLLDQNGKVIKSWEGFYEEGPDSFTAEVKQLVRNNH